MKKLKLILPFAISISFLASYASARDQIKIVGSSTVYPYCNSSC